MDRVILRFVYFSVDHPLLWEMQQHNIMHHHETEGISTSVEWPLHANLVANRGILPNQHKIYTLLSSAFVDTRHFIIQCPELEHF